ncbi:hypothetical protein LWI28_019223 [Acer negundo]|uniref:Uncharacterized protein n=1 Tax=Acer negundo TaxID=4023 RepID=A0AAD5JDX7_ACENE|nr:hypothetical protein LWI28_019223 [Acer negundo]
MSTTDADAASPPSQPQPPCVSLPRQCVSLQIYLSISSISSDLPSVKFLEFADTPLNSDQDMDTSNSAGASEKKSDHEPKTIMGRKRRDKPPSRSQDDNDQPPKATDVNAKGILGRVKN